jgi:L-serine dehydratase
MKYQSIAELVREAAITGQPLSEVVFAWEKERSDWSGEQIWAEMTARLRVMREAVQAGLTGNVRSLSGLVGGDAKRMFQAAAFIGELPRRAAAYALAVSEVNSGMGKIVACPTAGSCGIVPGALLAVADLFGCEETCLVRALFTAAGIGTIIAGAATVSGAVGGCQAECGSAAAMAAAAVVEMRDGTPEQSGQAAALALKNMLGLVCDPVAGLVEVPCVKRNAFAAVHALLAAQMALAGVVSAIPADEVVASMYQIGLLLPDSLKETSQAGLAQTATALKIGKELGRKTH